MIQVAELSMVKRMASAPNMWMVPLLDSSCPSTLVEVDVFLVAVAALVEQGSRFWGGLSWSAAGKDLLKHC